MSPRFRHRCLSPVVLLLASALAGACGSTPIEGAAGEGAGSGGAGAGNGDREPASALTGQAEDGTPRLWATELAARGRALAARPGGGALIVGEVDADVDGGLAGLILEVPGGVGEAEAWRLWGPDHLSLEALAPGEQGGPHYALGSLGKEGAEDAILVALDGPGEVRWARSIGGSSGDRGMSVAASPEGGAVVVVESFSFGPGTPSSTLHNALVVALDEEGEERWSFALGEDIEGDELSAVQPLPGGGGYLLAGSVESDGMGRDDAWLVNVDPEGGIRWSRAWGTEEDEELDTLVPAPGGGWMAVGPREMEAGNLAGFVLHFDAAGQLVWASTVEGGEFALWGFLGIAWSGSAWVMGGDRFPGLKSYRVHMDGAGELLGAWRVASPSPSTLRDMASLGSGMLASVGASKGAEGRDRIVYWTWDGEGSPCGVEPLAAGALTVKPWIPEGIEPDLPPYEVTDAVAPITLDIEALGVAELEAPAACQGGGG